MKVNAAKHAKEMYKALGLERSYRIAKRLYETTKPTNWSSLPKGEVFYTKDLGGNLKLKEKELAKNNNFWSNVVAILEKEYKK